MAAAAAPLPDGLPALEVESRGSSFVDGLGRRLTLRGVNLSGAKIPMDGATHRRASFVDDPAAASYVGRPFPLAAAEPQRQRQADTKPRDAATLEVRARVLEQQRA